MVQRFNTVQEWLDYSYRGQGLAEAMALARADAPMLTTTTGMFNAIFGELAFMQLNNQANTWNALPKKPRNNSGWRIRTARGFTLGTGGVADAGTVPATVKSTVVEVTAKPKLSVTSFEIGVMTNLLDGDDRYTFDEERKSKAEDHIVDIDKQLMGDVDTVAGNNWESVDRVCSSQSEEAGCLNPGDADIYGLDRSAGTTYDSYVDHNSGTDRALTPTMMRTAVTSIMQNSGKQPNVIITGYDTYAEILKIFDSQVRYTTETKIKLGVNGVETASGSDIGIEARAFMGIPIIQNQNTVVDGKSRIYFLNTDTVYLGVTMPTQYFESTNVLDRGVLTKKAMYMTIGELVCTQFSANGKIRDIL
jgi:hypothetical protein